MYPAFFLPFPSAYTIFMVEKIPYMRDFVIHGHTLSLQSVMITNKYD
jgi:hypothetical protein